MLGAFDFTDTVSASLGAPVEQSSKLDISASDLALLCEIGFTAIAAQMGERAMPIFELLDREQPHNAAGAIGMALVEVELGREERAIQRLRQAIASRKTCIIPAKAALCVLLTICGRRSEAVLLRREVLQGPDSGARRLVTSLGSC